MDEPAKPEIDRRSKRGRTGHSSKAAITELRRQVFELRKQGWSYTAIGQALGFTKQRAHQILGEALIEMIVEPAHEVFKLEMERFDALLVPVYSAAETGDHAAIAQVIKIMEQRAKLLGLDRKHRASAPIDRPVLQVQIVAVPGRGAMISRELETLGTMPNSPQPQGLSAD